MFDRLKRLLSGLRPETVGPPATPEPGVLDWITESTPYRFRTWLADPAQRDRALEILERRLGRELTVTVADEPDGGVRLDLVSTFGQGAAIDRPLNVLRREGVAVRGLELLDLHDDVGPAELQRLVAGWESGPYDRTLTRRIDALTGEETIRSLVDGQRRHPGSRSFRHLASVVAGKTVGSEKFMLRTALEEPDPATARAYAGSLIRRGTLADLAGDPFEPPEDLLVELSKRGGDLADVVYQVADHLPAPLSPALTRVVVRGARRRGDAAVHAVMALGRARPTTEVKEALVAALDSSSIDVQGIALDRLARVAVVDARPHWRAWLAGSSAPKRMAAEDVIGQFGEADDVPLAAEHLGKIIRRTSSISWEPPRGSEIIGLLVRHRDRPEARAALTDLSKRWPKLPEELRGWLRTYHPDVMPDGEPASTAERAAATAEPEGPVEAPLTWPLPSIESKGKELHLGFWDTDQTDIRDRFEDLAAEHPDVTIVDGDREWGTYRFDGADPQALIAELWAQAHGPPPDSADPSTKPQV